MRIGIHVRRYGAFCIVSVMAAAAGFAAAGPAPALQEPGPAEAPPTPRSSAPIDLAGWWVSIVTEDWRWRMMTPPRGDYASIPLNDEGRRVADTWDRERDEASGEACRPYGAAAVMRMPGRVQIRWEDDDTLRIDTDAGTQTRMLEFDAGAVAGGGREWQGYSVAAWETPQGGRGRGRGAGAPRGGSLKVVTTGMRPGYLRKNGVPYSEDAVLTEYFDRHSSAGAEWFTVTTIVEDPAYLTQPFITSTHFRKEPDGSGWNPTTCRTAPPVE